MKTAKGVLFFLAVILVPIFVPPGCSGGMRDRHGGYRNHGGGGGFDHHR